MEFMVWREGYLQAPSLTTSMPWRRFYRGWERPPPCPSSPHLLLPDGLIRPPDGRGSPRTRPAAARAEPLWEERKKPERRCRKLPRRPALRSPRLISDRWPEPESTGHAGCARSRRLAQKQDAPGRRDQRGTRRSGEVALGPGEGTLLAQWGGTGLQGSASQWGGGGGLGTRLPWPRGDGACRSG